MNNSAGDIIYRKFTTRNTSGVPTTLSGSPVISVYKNDLATQSTSGITLTVDFDGITGLNQVKVDTSTDTTFYANNNHYDLVITTGSVGGTVVIGEKVESFDLTIINTIFVGSNTSQSETFPGNAYYAEFSVSSAIGSAINADSLPVATANHNGVDDSGFVLTVTNIDIGRYKVTGTIPLTYIQNDSVWISVAATISSVPAKAIIDKFIISVPSNVRSGTCQAGSTSSTIKLDISANSTTNDIYKNQTVYIYGGTGAGQTALITSYTASTQVAAITPNWLVTPNNTSMYVIFPTNVSILADGVAHGGTPGSSTATFAMKRMQITNSGGSNALVVSTSGDTGYPIYISNSGADTAGIFFDCDNGPSIYAQNYGDVIKIVSLGDGNGVSIAAAGTGKKALLLAGDAVTDTLAIAAGAGSPIDIFDANGGITLSVNGMSHIKEASNTYDLKQLIIMIFEMAAYSKLSGLPTGPAIIRDFADTVNRATIFFDSNNNRTNVTINNAP